MNRSALPPEGFCAINNSWGKEDDKFVARIACAAPLEERTENRDVAEEWDLVNVATGVARKDSADDRRVAVHDKKIGLCFSFSSNHTSPPTGSSRDAAAATAPG